MSELRKEVRDLRSKRKYLLENELPKKSEKLKEKEIRLRHISKQLKQAEKLLLKKESVMKKAVRPYEEKVAEKKATELKIKSLNIMFY